MTPFADCELYGLLTGHSGEERLIKCVLSPGCASHNIKYNSATRTVPLDPRHGCTWVLADVAIAWHLGRDAP